MLILGLQLRGNQLILPRVCDQMGVAENGHHSLPPFIHQIIWNIRFSNSGFSVFFHQNLRQFLKHYIIGDIPMILEYIPIKVHYTKHYSIY